MEINCYFCQRNIKEINFRETHLLKRFISGLGKIKGRKKTKLCRYHQKILARAVKRARILGLLSYMSK